MTTSESILFHEEQAFRKLLIIVLLLIGMVLPIVILVSGMTKEKLNSQEMILSLIAIMTIEIPIFVLLWLTKFEIVVTPDWFGYRWWPLQRKYRKISKDEAIDVKTRKSPAFTYGSHWLFGYGWVNNVRGRMGIQISLKNGKRLYLGTQRLNELKVVLERVLNIRIRDFRNEF